MKTEGKGSETHLQKAGLQMNTFPLAFPYSLSSTEKKKRERETVKERDERKRDDSVLVLSHSLLSFCWFVSE